MLPQVRQFVSETAERLPWFGPVYEFGAYRVEGQEAIADMRPLFPGVEYVGCDMRLGPGVDRVENLHNIDLPDGIAGTVLCMETLEHVEFVRRAVEEMHRILAPGGFCIVSSLMHFPIHDFPHDYWRFTPQGMASLLRPFESHHISWLGDAKLPRHVFGIGAKRLDGWQARLRRNALPAAMGARR
jgi:SAM-dependent methyltransferase